MTPAIDIANAVDWTHPLNRGRGAWWLTPYGAGGRVPDLVAGNHLSAAGTTGNMGWRPSGNGSMNAPVFPNATPGGTPTVFAIASRPLGFVNNSSAFTVAAWALPASLNTGGGTFATFFGQVANAAAGSANFPFHIACRGTGSATDWIFEVGRSDGGGWASPQATGGSVVAGVPARVVGVFNRIDARLYVNGRLAAAPVAITTTSGSTTTPTTVGANNANGTNRAFAGSTWDSTAWNRALSPAEVALDYQLSRQGYVGRDSPIRWLGGVSTLTGPRR